MHRPHDFRLQRRWPAGIHESADHHYARLRIEVVVPGRPRPCALLRSRPARNRTIYRQYDYGRVGRSAFTAGLYSAGAFHGTRCASPGRDHGSSSGLENEIAGRRMDLDIPRGDRAVSGVVEHAGGNVRPANPVARRALQTALPRTNAHPDALTSRSTLRVLVFLGVLCVKVLPAKNQKLNTEDTEKDEDTENSRMNNEFRVCSLNFKFETQKCRSLISKDRTCGGKSFRLPTKTAAHTASRPAKASPAATSPCGTHFPATRWPRDAGLRTFS